MPICPNCKQEIEYLVNRYERETTQKLVVDSEGDCDYREVTINPKYEDLYICPECDKILFTDILDAAGFLKCRWWMDK